MLRSSIIGLRTTTALVSITSNVTNEIKLIGLVELKDKLCQLLLLLQRIFLRLEEYSGLFNKVYELNASLKTSKKLT